MSLTAKTASAVGWMTGAKIAQQALQFGLAIFLMRLLGPETFGLIGMVLVFTGFASVFSDMGFSSALIQRQNLTEAHRSTVFWLTVSVGALLSLLLFAVSPLIATFYKEPLLESLTAGVALTFVLGAPGAVPHSLLQKSLRFDQIAIVQIGSLIVSGSKLPSAHTATDIATAQARLPETVLKTSVTLISISRPGMAMHGIVIKRLPIM